MFMEKILDFYCELLTVISSLIVIMRAILITFINNGFPQHLLQKIKDDVIEDLKRTHSTIITLF